MKNALVMVFLIISFAIGMALVACIYFGVVFGVLDWMKGVPMNDRAASDLGVRVGMVAGVMGIIAGALVALDAGWDWFKRPDGSPDWVARVAGIVVGVPLILLMLYSSPEAFKIVARYGGLGFLAAVGFGGIASRIDSALTKQSG